MSRVLLILGASSDIARAVAHKFADEGWDILLCGRNTELLARDAVDLRLKYKVNAEACKFDALAFESHSGFWEDLKLKPSAVVCAFGYLGEQKVNERNWSETRKAIDTNFTGAVSILNIVANDFEAGKSGVIIGISSVAGDRGRMSNYMYGSAKAGFTAYLSGLRSRLYKSGVRVITVKPGFVATKMTEGLDLPAVLTTTPGQVAMDIFRAYKTGKPIVYSRWYWRLIILGIIHIPEWLFQKLKL